MNALAPLLTGCLLAIASLAHALPSTLASFPRISGEVVEITKGDICTAIRIKVDDGTDRKMIRSLHNALKRKTYYPFREFRQPGREEALLIFVDKEADPLKIGDKIVVHGYSIIADLEVSRRGRPICGKIERK